MNNGHLKQHFLTFDDIFSELFELEKTVNKLGEINFGGKNAYNNLKVTFYFKNNLGLFKLFSPVMKWQPARLSPSVS